MLKLKLQMKLNTLATWCEELTHWKRSWCWERSKVWGEGDERGWDGWMASPTWWTWVWVNSRSWWWTGRPGVLQSMGSKRVGHDWATELILLLRKLYWREQDFYPLYSSGTDRLKKNNPHIKKFVTCQKALMPNNYSFHVCLFRIAFYKSLRICNIFSYHRIIIFDKYIPKISRNGKK